MEKPAGCSCSLAGRIACLFQDACMPNRGKEPAGASRGKAGRTSTDGLILPLIKVKVVLKMACRATVHFPECPLPGSAGGTQAGRPRFFRRPEVLAMPVCIPAVQWCRSHKQCWQDDQRRPQDRAGISPSRPEA
ncbi:hypothetical protein CENSYa_0827 [Cenarchaeum symbiosum A]|uniref:Uncharacterized protein n=1 Tax=Cenarchaeum symbiosum (strain A) TaxID=414004 RepID=A0RVU3_CENSY|nr:hypothetical protein CENSYa_0827 [Cenarchaeum symbiosum A]